MDGFERICQIGKVTAIDVDKRKVRVYFESSGMTSGWLSVLQQPNCLVDVKEAYCDESKHSHSAATTVWMPNINDIVLCLYLPIFNSDGFIVGVIQ